MVVQGKPDASYAIIHCPIYVLHVRELSTNKYPSVSVLRLTLGNVKGPLHTEHAFVTRLL